MFCFLSQLQYSHGFTLLTAPVIKTAVTSTTSIQMKRSGGENKSEGNSSATKVLVLGGGFGGLNTALSLSSSSSKNNIKITLVDDKERFVFLPLLYELLTGDADLDEVAPTYKSLLQGNDAIEFVQGSVYGIDAPNSIVYLKKSPYASLEGSIDGDCCMNYDYLVLATGMQSTNTQSSSTKTSRQNVPGAYENALPFYTLQDCYELKKRLNLLKSLTDMNKEERVKVSIVGAGYSGVELALNIVEFLSGNVEVTLLHRGGSILEGASEFTREKAMNLLKERGVRVLTSSSVNQIVNSVDSDGKYDCTVQITTLDKDTSRDDTIESNLLLWTAGARPQPSSQNPQSIMNSILPRDYKNRIVTNSFLQVKNSPNIFCIGDASRCAKDPFPANAQVAIQQSAVVSSNIQDLISSENGSLVPFKFIDLGNMMSLGSDEATITSLGGLVELDGKFASVFRRLIYAVRMPTIPQIGRAAIASTSQRLQKEVSVKKRNKKRKP